MTTMTWGNSEGTKGRCDAKCHNALAPSCHCMCGGRYHGVSRQPGGLREAMEQFESEIISEANHRAAKLGLTIKFKGIMDLFSQQQTFLLEAPSATITKTQ